MAVNELASVIGERESRVDAAIAEYLLARQNRQPFDKTAWLERYANLADELREFLADEDHVGGILAPLQQEQSTPGPENLTDPNITRTHGGSDDTATEVPRIERLGDYEILDEIARGGMGVVFKARQKSLNRVVALKMVLGNRLASKKDIERFQREAEAAAGLDHPNIVPIYEVGAIDGMPFFSMKLIEGGSLQQHKNRYLSDPQSVARLLTIVARAVHHAHQRGILHRDLKPSNVLLDERGEPHVVDFGLAKRIENDQAISQSGAIVGTPSYMAPEQARGQHEKLTTAVDVYGLGVILYELLTGQAPFRGVTTADTLIQVLTDDPVRPAQVRRDVPRDLETICLKCLEKDPTKRYGSAEACADDLERWQRNMPIRARPATFRERTIKWMRRNRVIAGLTGFSALLLLVIAIGGVALSVRMFNALGQSRVDRTTAEKDRDTARNSEREARKRELGALISEAKSQRLSRRIGQRFDTLATIRRAVALAHELEEPSTTFDELRNLAIGALAMPDIEETPLWFTGPNEPGWKRHEWSVTRSAHLYAESSRSGAVSISRVAADPGQCTELARLPGYGTESTVDWCSDERHLIVWHMTQPRYRVQLWRMDGETPQLMLDEHDGCNKAGLAPDGRTFVTVNTVGSVRAYDAATGREKLTLTISAEDYTYYRDIAFHGRLPHAFLIADGAIVTFDWKAGKEVSRLPVTRAGISSIAIHPRDEILYIAYNDYFQAWDLQKQKPLFTCEHRGGGVELSIDAAGDVLVSRGWGTVAKFWNPYTGQEVFSTPAAGRGRFLNDARFALAYPDEYGLERKQLKRYTAGREYRTLNVGIEIPGRKDCNTVGMHPDGRLLAIGTKQGWSLVDLQTGRERSFIDKPPSSVLFVDPTGTLWQSIGANRWQRSIAADKHEPLRYSIGPPQRVPVPTGTWGNIASNGNGSLMAIGLFSGGLIVWPRDRPQDAATFQAPTPNRDCQYPAVSPNGAYFAGGAHNGSGIRLWNRQGELLREFLTDVTWTKPQFSPDGQWLYDWHGVRWRVGDWSEGANLRWGKGVGSRGPIRFSPDSSMIAVDSAQGSIILLDASGERELARLEDPNLHTAIDMLFSPDGKNLITLSFDGACVHVWDLQRIRAGLIELGLDWDAPPYPAATQENASRSIDVTILGEEFFSNPQEYAEYERQRPLLALAANPFDAKAHAELGERLLSQAGKSATAYKHLRIAQTLDPGDFTALVSLARAAINTSRNAEAIEAATLALAQKLPPRNARFYRAQASFNPGRFTDAVADYDVMMGNLEPNSTIPLLRGTCHWKLGNREKALADYRIYVAAVKQTPVNLNSVARNYLGPPTLSPYHNALLAFAFIERALKEKPDDPKSLVTLAVSKFYLGQIDESKAILDRASQAPEVPEPLYWYLRSALQVAQCNAAEGRAAYQQAVAQAGPTPPLQSRLRTETLALLQQLQRSAPAIAIAGPAGVPIRR